ncbi:predicted protein [Sclerotinia sclerotiorum 1980 UF-70]|uniref:Uncharacterized protein n=2 Tax=Sclerotinia sclerotiorum (strain ATCC 18683 / 1980 / Ss-1) TaxID=665079 RepID=A7EL62_SCLS1|nr:predicted protein [Sclerotinia sclerotiorum 1980 UF-70]APA09743.1 hypothetical protein sscle_05g045130 [Sclerotinia sclerotiorum 1980 UF-70]EDO03578.1 predicted protein [Sclerotinia sclerotiorum 1980 UF-70]
MSDFISPPQDAVIASSSSQPRHGENRIDTVLQAIKGWPTANGDGKENCPICFDTNIFREPSHITGTNMQDMNSIQTVLSRSTSSGSRRSMNEFELQRWQTRMGGVGNVDPRNLPGPRSHQGAIRVRLPPVVATTTHGHPATPTSVELTPVYTRRTYENANISSYEMRNQANSHPQPTDRSREAINPRWRNWDFLTHNRRTTDPITMGTRNTYSVADVVSVAMNIGTVARIPRNERTTPTTGENNTNIPVNVNVRRESSNNYSIVNAMGQALGVGTVVAMPRAEWRNPNSNQRRRIDHNELSDSMSNININLDIDNREPPEVIRETRRRENNSSAANSGNLSEMPGLASSMWARTWG